MLQKWSHIPFGRWLSLVICAVQVTSPYSRCLYLRGRPGPGHARHVSPHCLIVLMVTALSLPRETRSTQSSVGEFLYSQTSCRRSPDNTNHDLALSRLCGSLSGVMVYPELTVDPTPEVSPATPSSLANTAFVLSS